MIVSYSWKEGGNEIATGAAPSVAFTVGAHDVTLTVTDNGGATASDHVNVTVSPNAAPTANAGPDQFVSDSDGNGVQSVTLSGGGTDSDGTITSYVWTENGNQIASGPTQTVNFNVG